LSVISSQSADFVSFERAIPNSHRIAAVQFIDPLLAVQGDLRIYNEKSERGVFAGTNSVVCSELSIHG